MTMEAALAALAEPRRREILLFVRDEPHSVNEIAAQVEVTQQAVSQHLRVLKEVGLVDVQPEGRRRLYVIRPAGLEAVEAFLAQLWPISLQRLKGAAEAKHNRGG